MENPPSTDFSLMSAFFKNSCSCMKALFSSLHHWYSLFAMLYSMPQFFVTFLGRRGRGGVMVLCLIIHALLSLTVSLSSWCFECCNVSSISLPDALNVVTLVLSLHQMLLHVIQLHVIKTRFLYFYANELIKTQ